MKTYRSFNFNTVLVFFLVQAVNIIYAQTICGTQSPTHEEKEAVMAEINQQEASGSLAKITALTIPIAVHIIRYDDGSGDISNTTIDQQIDVINNNFSSTPFQFSLQSIDRTDNTDWAACYYISAVKESLAVDPEKTLNLYFCPEKGPGGLTGYSNFAHHGNETNTKLDGPVVYSGTVPNGSEQNSNLGNTASHEIGHYLGLYHTFEGYDCDGDGDYIPDTPSQSSPTYDCPDYKDSCPLTNGEDPYHNFMDYSFDICRTEFTHDQSDRMQDIVQIYRKGLLGAGIQVSIDQKVSFGIRVGSVSKWNGSGWDGVPLGQPITLYGKETFLGSQNVYYNQKYHEWERNQANTEPDNLNHHTFTAKPNDNNFTSRFAPTYSGVTLQNKLEGVAVSGGTIDFIDPWFIDYADDDFGGQLRNRGKDAIPHTRSAPFYPNTTNTFENGKKYNGVFLNENSSFDPNKPIYSVRTPLTQPINGITAYFTGWSTSGASTQQIDDNPTGYDQKAVVFTSSSAKVYANYKGLHVSNSSTAFSNNSQRKFIETRSGEVTWLHQVYTSMGHVWLEHSSDGGDNWILGNGSQPLSGAAGGKNPSIAYYYDDANNENWIGIVWQEPHNSKYKIQGIVFSQQTNVSEVPVCPQNHGETIFEEPSDAYSVNANPNLVLAGVPSLNGTTPGGPYLLTIERKTNSGNWQRGVNWLVGEIHGYYLGWNNAHGIVSGTNQNSINVQISLDPQFEAYPNVRINLIRQQDSPGTIFAHYLYLNKANGDWEYYQYNFGMISYSAAINFSPSIVTLPNSYFSACWSEYYDMAFYKYGSPTLYRYGNTVQSCSINKLSGSSSSGFAVWSQHPSGWSNKSIRFDNGSPVASTIRTLSTSGKYVQAGNGAQGQSNMYVSSFYPFTSPYSFSTSGTLGPLNKKNTDLVEGRGFEIHNGEGSFSYQFEDLNVDGANISFVDAPDGVDYGKTEILNNALITEPFVINDDSRIIFSEKSGFADSLATAGKLKKDGFVNFKVELIDEATGKVTATLKTKKINSSNTYPAKSSAYLVKPKEFAGKTVRIKISLESNLIERFSPQLVVGDSAKIPDYLKERFSKKISNLFLTKKFSDVNETLIKAASNNLEVINLDIPTTYVLEQNYPNPFNPETKIAYHLAEKSNVKLVVYDLLGRKVKTLVNKVQDIGRYQVTFDASNLATGVYVYTLQAGTFRETKKMILVK